jgi:hypothetical protein
MLIGDGWDNAAHCARSRGHAHDVARSDWKASLELARDIPLPWYRSQAISHVATVAPEEHVAALLNESLDIANSDTDSYRVIGVRAWIIEAAIARGHLETARSLVNLSIEQSSSIMPIRSRAQVVQMILDHSRSLGWETALPLGELLFDIAQQMLTSEHRRHRSWGKTYLRRAAWSLSMANSTEAHALVLRRFGPHKAQSFFKPTPDG